MKKKIVVTLLALFIAGFTGNSFAAPSAYSDVPKEHWAYQSITKLVKAGIIEGYGDNGTFNGNKTLTRYEMAAIVANAMTKEEKADAAAKAEIEKLKAEFGTELDKLGVRMGAVEKKVDKLGNIEFHVWTRYLTDTERDVKSGNSTTNTQIRYGLMMKSQLDENAWAFSKIGTTDTTSESQGSTNTISIQQAYVRLKYGDWNFNIGRQGDNVSHPANFINTGMLWMSSSNWDGVSAFTGSADNHLYGGILERTFPGGITDVYGNSSNSTRYTGLRKFYIMDTARDLTPNFNLRAAYVKDTGVRNGSQSVIDFKSIGSIYKFGKNNNLKLTSEIGKNSRAAYAAGIASDGKGWITDLQYGQTNSQKRGSWDVHVDYRHMNPGMSPFGGWENPGGPYNPTYQGLGNNCSNVQGIGLYYEFVPAKNVWVQLSAYNFKTVVDTSASTGLSQKYRQSYRLIVDTFF
ncbi:MAG: S-layer protein [Firmicutes bacterium]|nr:S-layer protein [Bacillota bacterium]